MNLKIFDVNGRIFKEIQLEGLSVGFTTIPIEITELESGLYTMEIQANAVNGILKTRISFTKK